MSVRKSKFLDDLRTGDMTKVSAVFQGDCSKRVVQQLLRNGHRSLIVAWKVRSAGWSVQAEGGVAIQSLRRLNQIGQVLRCGAIQTTMCQHTQLVQNPLWDS